MSLAAGSHRGSAFLYPGAATPIAAEPADRAVPTVAHAYAELLAADEARRRASGLARLRSMANPIQASD